MTLKIQGFDSDEPAHESHGVLGQLLLFQGTVGGKDDATRTTDERCSIHGILNF